MVGGVRSTHVQYDNFHNFRQHHGNSRLLRNVLKWEDNFQTNTRKFRWHLRLRNHKHLKKDLAYGTMFINTQAAGYISDSDVFCAGRYIFVSCFLLTCVMKIISQDNTSSTRDQYLIGGLPIVMSKYSRKSNGKLQIKKWNKSY